MEINFYSICHFKSPRLLKSLGFFCFQLSKDFFVHKVKSYNNQNFLQFSLNTIIKRLSRLPNICEKITYVHKEQLVLAITVIKSEAYLAPCQTLTQQLFLQKTLS